MQTENERPGGEGRAELGKGNGDAGGKLHHPSVELQPALFAEPEADGADRRRAPPEPQPEAQGVDFDWGDVVPVVAAQQPVAIYENTAGNIIIRRPPMEFVEADDVWLAVTPFNARLLARALVDLADAIEGA